MRVVGGGHEYPFNSLSRDHPGGVSGVWFDYYLSTPSLGITCDAESAFHLLKRRILSTPSLGITYLVRLPLPVVDDLDLSTPSLGIT